MPARPGHPVVQCGCCIPPTTSPPGTGAVGDGRLVCRLRPIRCRGNRLGSGMDNRSCLRRQTGLPRGDPPPPKAGCRRTSIHSGAVAQGRPVTLCRSAPLALPLLVRLQLASPRVAASVPSAASAPPAADTHLSCSPDPVTMPARCSCAISFRSASSPSISVPPDTQASASLCQPCNPCIRVLDNATRPRLFLPQKDLRGAGGDVGFTMLQWCEQRPRP